MDWIGLTGDAAVFGQHQRSAGELHQTELRGLAHSAARMARSPALPRAASFRLMAPMSRPRLMPMKRRLWHHSAAK